MVISRSSIPQQIMKPGVKKKKKLKQGGSTKKGIISNAKDVLKTLDTTRVMPEKLKKNTARKIASKAARFGLRILSGSHPITWGTMIGGAALDEYNKPENKLKRLKRQRRILKERRTGTDRQKARHGSGVLTAAEERELDRKQEELEKSIKKYMGGSLNKRRK